MKTYHPFISSDVPASSPHPSATVYRVSFGLEYWGEEPHEVAKVQMVYDGAVAGRRSPSYPSGTDDFERVVEALHQLEQRARHMPMTFERLRAFRPDSPQAERLRRDNLDATLDRITDSIRD